MSGNAWIIIGVICAAISPFAITYGFHVKKNDDRGNNITNVESDYVQRDKIDTGGGDYVAGDKITTIEQSGNSEQIDKLEDKVDKLAEIINTIARDKSPYLNGKYGENFVVAGVTNKGFVVPASQMNPALKFKWETGEVISVTDDEIEVRVPDFVGANNNAMVGASIRLKKEIGSGMTLEVTPQYVSRIEVIGLDNDLVVIGIGVSTN